MVTKKLGVAKRGHARDVAENISELVVVPSSVHGPDVFSHRMRRGGICRQPPRHIRYRLGFAHSLYRKVAVPDMPPWQGCSRPG